MGELERRQVPVASLVDGLSVVDNLDKSLTVCACWQVKFNGYTFEPTIVVPFDTGLDTVEALARRSLVEHLGSSDYHNVQIATNRVVLIQRQADVYLDPHIG